MVLLAIVAAASLIAAGPVSSVSASPTVDPAPADSAEEPLRLAIPTAHPVSLRDAAEAATNLGEKVVGFRFENGNVVGEYAANGTLSISEFLAFFEKDYGTQPAVTQVLIERPSQGSKGEVRETADSGGVLPWTVGHELPAIEPDPVKYGGTIAERANENAKVQELAAGRVQRSTVAAVSDWRPDSTNHGIFASENKAFFGQQFTWDGMGLYSNLPNGIGLEFEINEDNGSVATPQNVRPACFDTQYKNRFWASNHSYSWVTTDWFGSVSASTMGAYADYNDATDLCRNNAISVGLRYPKQLTSTGGAYAVTTLDLVIFAPRGLASSSLISGNVQAVTDHYCTITPYSLTDCMGVTPIVNVWGGSPAGTYNRGTLSISRAFYVPSRCWNTYDKGFTLWEDPCG